MQIYKRLPLLFTGALLLGGMLWTCSDDFLEVAPKGALAPSVLATEVGIDGVLLGAYAQLGGRGNYFSGASNWTNGSIQGGEANKGTEDGDFTDVNEVVRYALTATSLVPADRWRGLFEGVSRSNQVLELLAASEDPLLTPGDRTRLEGEARFLRGHYYFQLQISYGQAPILTPGLSLEEVVAVASSSDLWPFIEEDFKYAYDNLPETLAEAGRANKWAAGAYYGKVLLHQGKFSEARTVFRNVVDNGKTTSGLKFGLLPSYANAFNGDFDNGAESVFAVQAAANSGTVNVANPDFVLNFIQSGPGGCCGFFQPSYDLVNSFRTNNGLPLLDNSYNSSANKLADDLGITSDAPFTPDAGPVDPRLDHSVGRRGIPYLDWQVHPGQSFIRKQDYGGPYSPKKFVYSKSQVGTISDGTSWTAGYSAINYNIIRFADVLLMLAETEIEADELEAGRTLINRVRGRAKDDVDVVKKEDGSPAANYRIELYPAFSSKGMATAALRLERKLELSGEGHRFFDLVRWGNAKEELTRIIANEQQYLPAAYRGAVFNTPKNLYYPIPQGQIDLQGSAVLPQNEGY